MWPDQVSNPGPLTCESGALPTALCGPAMYIELDLAYARTDVCGGGWEQGGRGWGGSGV